MPEALTVEPGPEIAGAGFIEWPSPFLPGTNIQFAWDSTSIGWLKGCPRLYQYMMVEGWRPKEDSDDLRFGLEYHAALEEYDHLRAEGAAHLIALRDVVRHLLVRTFGWKTANEYKNRWNLLRTVVWYLDKFEHDKAKTYKLKDGTPAVELSFKFELDWGPEVSLTENVGTLEVPIYHTYTPNQPYLLCGHLDRVVTFAGDLYVMDRKTTKSTPSTWYFTQYEPDNQMTCYTIAARLLFETPIRGVIIDAAQVLQDSSSFARGMTYRTEGQINEWLEDLKFLFAQAEDYAAEGYWPMNDKYCNTYRSEASGKVGCPFREICGKDPAVRERFLAAGFVKQKGEERWNPLVPR